jgi:hypothetical protein
MRKILVLQSGVNGAISVLDDPGCNRQKCLPEVLNTGLAHMTLRRRDKTYPWELLAIASTGEP